MDAGRPDPGIREWVSAQLGSTRGLAADAIEEMPSRLGGLYRVRAKGPRGPETVFVKVLQGDSGSGAERWARLPVIAAAFDAQADSRFVDIVALDPVRGWLVMRQAPGTPLSAYRKRALARGNVSSAAGAWRCVGSWLRRFHGSDPQTRPFEPSAEVGYVTERLTRWASAAPGDRHLADRASMAVRRLAARLTGMPIVPCHGDVSVGNIFVDGVSACLVDFSDFEYSLPALDLSQAVLETQEYARVGPWLPLPLLGRACERALQAGYGTGWPAGPSWWLPHLRNLTVLLVTLAERRSAGQRLRYTRLRRDLIATLARVETDSSLPKA